MEQYIKITEPARNIRRMARAELRGRFGTAILTYVLYCALLSVPPVLIEILFGGGVVEAPQLFNIGPNGVEFSFDNVMPALTERQARAYTIGPLYMFVMEGPLLLGFSTFLIALVRGAARGPGMLFDGFNNFFRAFGLILLVSILVILWILPFAVPGFIVFNLLPNAASAVLVLLLCFVPAVVALLAYSQAFFLLADEPRHGLGLAAKRSRWMMSGNKRKLFCLWLSFAGWFILSSLAASAFTSALDNLAPLSVSALLTPVLYGAVMAPAYMYMSAAGAIFYDILIGRRRLLPLGQGFAAEVPPPRGDGDA